LTQTKIARLTYVIPNLITCSGLALGVVAIFLAMHDRIMSAAWLVTLCVLLDKLDGTAARLLKAGSDIGVQLDSFSDFITFIVAPAVLVATALTSKTSLYGAMPVAAMAYASALVYVVAGAVRLAKFNCLEQSGEGPGGFFIGLPTTLGGAFFATLLLTLDKYDVFQIAAPYLPLLLVVYGMLMVSGVYLPKLGRRKMKVVNLFFATNLAVVPVLIICRILPEYLLFLVLLYVLVGVIFANRKGAEIV